MKTPQALIGIGASNCKLLVVKPEKRGGLHRRQADNRHGQGSQENDGTGAREVHAIKKGARSEGGHYLRRLSLSDAIEEINHCSLPALCRF